MQSDRKLGTGRYTYMSTKVACLILLSWSCLLNFNLLAQDLKRHGFASGDTLSEVQVKGFKPSAAATSPTPLQILGGRQLERLNSLSVADALRYFSGVQIKDYGGTGGLKTVNIRSLGAQHTAVFYDGLQLGNAQNGEIDIGRFSLDNIGEIDLYNAQRSTIYQPARAFAVASSLYLQTKTPYFKPGEKDHLKLSLRAGSFGLANPSFNWEHQISKNISSSVSTEWLKSNGRYKFRYTNSVYDTTAIRQNGDTEALRLEGGLQGSFSDSSKWTFKILHYRNERGLPRAIVNNNFESQDRQWDRNTLIQSSWKSNVRRRFEWMVSGKYANDHMRYLQPQFDNIAGKLDTRYEQQEYYFSSSGQYHLSPILDVALSADLLINKMSSDLEQYAYPTRFTKFLALASDFHPGRFRLQGSLLGTVVDENTQNGSAAKGKKELSPAVTASWQPFRTEDLRIRAFYKNIFRLPTLNDLYYTYIGNTALKPEYVSQYDAGFTFQKTIHSSFLQHISLNADAYYNKVKDKIVAVPGENIATWMMMNLGKVDIKGAETTISTTAGIGKITLNAGLAYTYQQALDVTRETDFNYRHQIPYTPEHSGSLTLGGQIENFWFNYSYIYTGERYSQKANTADNYMGPWYTHDISVSGSFKARKTKIKATAEVSNLFNQYRDVVLNYPMPGRSYRFSLTMNY